MFVLVCGTVLLCFGDLGFLCGVVVGAQHVLRITGLIIKNQSEWSFQNCMVHPHGINRGIMHHIIILDFRLVFEVEGVVQFTE